MKFTAFRTFAKSKNKIYYIFKHKFLVPLSFAGLTLIFGIIGFSSKGETIGISILNSIKLFGLDFPSDPLKLNAYIYVAITLAIITLTFTITLIFIKDGLERFQRSITYNKEHIAVFGLGEASRSFLNSYSKEKRKERIVIIESDPNNEKLEEYRNMGYGVLVGDSLSENTLERLNFKNMKYALIALGNDRINIELAEKIIKIYSNKNIGTEIKLIIHIQNKDLDILFHQNLDLPDLKMKKGMNSQPIDIKTFSFFNEAAEQLFDKYSIDGDRNEYINSGASFTNILIGNGELLKSVIYQMALVSHLPKNNKQKVIIVDEKAKNIVENIKKHLHYDHDNFPKFIIEGKPLDKNKLEYFSHEIWTTKNLVNVIIAFDEEAENLDLALELFNRTFISKDIDKEKTPKIIFAIYNQTLLSKLINKDQKALKNFFTFGNSEEVLSYTNLIEEENDFIARLINSDYGKIYHPHSLLHDDGKTRADWHDFARYSDKQSNIAQAKHIDIKLKAMGLKKESLDDYLNVDPKNPNRDQPLFLNLKSQIKKKDPKSLKKILLIHNRNLLSEVFEKDRSQNSRNEYYSNGVLDKNELIAYSKNINKYTLEVDKKRAEQERLISEKEAEGLIIKPENKIDLIIDLNEFSENLLSGTAYPIRFFPNDYSTLFEKMMRMEHKRWTTFHYLNGWKHAKIKNKDKKEHDCLKSFDEFEEKRLKVSSIYDIYSFLYLPNYLAEAAYVIVKRE